MYAITISDDLWKTIFTFIGTLSWPLAVLIIVCILRWPISWLIMNIKKLGWKDLIIEFGDKANVPVYFPEENKIRIVAVETELFPTKAEVKITRLSDEEIEQSKQKAQKRLKEDTKRVGYQRGKLFQLDNGKWAISWDIQLSDRMVIKG